MPSPPAPDFEFHSRHIFEHTMKLQCPQVTWHGGENGKNAPILSLDFHPFDRHLLVTSGSDAEARVCLDQILSINDT
jgi:hypothetical protein